MVQFPKTKFTYEIKDVELKYGQVSFYSGWTTNVTIRTNFIPGKKINVNMQTKSLELKIGQVILFSLDEQNVSLSELIDYNNKLSKN